MERWRQPISVSCVSQLGRRCMHVHQKARACDGQAASCDCHAATQTEASREVSCTLRTPPWRTLLRCPGYASAEPQHIFERCDSHQVIELASKAACSGTFQAERHRLPGRHCQGISETKAPASAETSSRCGVIVPVHIHSDCHQAAVCGIPAAGVLTVPLHCVRSHRSGHLVHVAEPRRRDRLLTWPATLRGPAIVASCTQQTWRSGLDSSAPGWRAAGRREPWRCVGSRSGHTAGIAADLRPSSQPA